MIELAFAANAGKTCLVHHFQHAPLQMFRPLYVDPHRPGMAFIYLIQTGGGVLQGDRYRLDLDCGAGSSVHFTTQASTRIYRADQGLTSQVVNLTAAADSFVEYLPDTIIPYRNSRFFQRTAIVADPAATVILGEVLLPGRVAYGERHDYTQFIAQTEARDPDGRLLFADVIHLDPRGGPPDSPGRLGPFDVLASLYIITRRAGHTELIDRLRRALAPHQDVLAGVSELPNECGISVRMLGRTSAAVLATRHAAWNESRLALAGTPAPNLRKS